MFEQVVAQPTKSLLAALSVLPAISQFYLAGGTALALQLGHRVSDDLDWFSAESFEPNDLLGQLRTLQQTEVTNQTSAALTAIVGDIEVGFYRYDAPLLFDKVSYRGIAVADCKDILCMKLVTIGQRAAKRDYVDLYFGLVRVLSFPDLLGLVKRKYHAVNYSEYHLLRSMTYFDEIEAEPMPRLLADANWPDIRAFLKSEVAKQIG